jgi:hypothetical protein
MFLRSVSVIAAGCALLVASASINAQQQPQRGPSTPEERQQALKYIADYQADPLNPDLKSEVKWVTIWMIEIPDLHVNICFLVDLPKGDKKHSQTLFNAMMMAQTGFAIQHRNDQPDIASEYQAGLEAMLNAYEKVVAENPKDRQPALDDLLDRRKAGTLSDYVKQQSVTRCKN